MVATTRVSTILLCVLSLAACGFHPTPPSDVRGAAGAVYVVDDESYWSASPGFKPAAMWIGLDSSEEWSKVSSLARGSRIAIAGYAVRDSSQVGFHLDPATTAVDVGGVPEEFHYIGAVGPIVERYPDQPVHVFLIVKVVDLAD